MDLIFLICKSKIQTSRNGLLNIPLPPTDTSNKNFSLSENVKGKEKSWQTDYLEAGPTLKKGRSSSLIDIIIKESQQETPKTKMPMYYTRLSIFIILAILPLIVRLLGSKGLEAFWLPILNANMTWDLHLKLKIKTPNGIPNLD